MKKILIYCLLLITTFGFGQKMRNNVIEKVKSQKIAYLTQKLDLSEEEATKFWPVFNQYEKEKEEARLAEAKVKMPVTEAEANQMLETLINLKTAELAIEKKYISKFKTVIPSTKVIKLFHFERQFRKEMVETIRTRMDKTKG